MQRFKATVAYDGTHFAGFQKQPEQFRTVQRELENGLFAIFNKQIPIIGAGRTDTAVHATGQVISFDCDWKHPVEALHNALNANLPDDVVALKIEQIHTYFHPRFDAKVRTYQYLVYNKPVRHPLYRNCSWHVVKPLDMTMMNEAAVYLKGEHDFATFGQPPQGNNSVREIFQAIWDVQEPYLVFTVSANAFLYRMVRSLVGSLKQVGEKSWTVEQFLAAMQAKNRDACGKVAPPQGVYLVSVEY